LLLRKVRIVRSVQRRVLITVNMTHDATPIPKLVKSGEGGAMPLRSLDVCVTETDRTVRDSVQGTLRLQ
jgi:hypothetical protein